MGGRTALHRALGSRGLMSVAVVVTLVLAGGAVLQLSRPAPDTRSYCAEMPDSIGLREGSAVTVMGIRVGEVTGIEPNGRWARVRFTVREDRTLPENVGAVTVSDTLVADRNLALVGDEPDGPGWDPGQCITNTLTPQSLSRTFDALAGLADELNGAHDPARRGDLGAGLTALDQATADSAERINTVIRELGRALSAPDAAIGHLGALIDALTELTGRARSGWDTVETMVTELPRTFNDIVVIAFPPIIEIVTYLAQVLPQLNDVVMMFGTPAVRALDAMTDLPAMLASGVGSLSEVIRMTPAIASGFAQALDPATGRPTIRYAAPGLAVPPQDAPHVCPALEALMGQRCTVREDGAVTIPALPLLLATVSAR
ncbi:MCE family protein [Nocardia puris]|uniref:MlaD family protein n=1 Tax=Nocardia puris TaxID=208602 RepID=UPI0018943CEC|nr:MlaD family protein [Nocardia puris]MBF6209686.1 MCE family protein [Nocardia puris]MBF6366258.1 MCE family protein [Nocardia puris]MBF6458403.1 MCE family protein [Nocardia puris]